MMKKTRIARICRAAVFLAALLCLYAPSALAAPLDDCAAGRHQYAETRRVEATAMEDGEIAFVCSVCGHRLTETLFATNHLWGAWVTDREATCTAPGEKHRTCTRGQRHDEYAALPALGHDYRESIAEPGCEEEGVKTFTCSRCEDKYTERIDALGHGYRETGTVEPSCLEPGKKTFVCANDPAHTYEEAIPAIGSHDFGEWQVETPAAEGTEGQEVRVCNRCGFKEPRALAALPVPATEPPSTLPVLDIVLVSASSVSLGFFAFLLVPYFLCLAYLKKRQEAIERRDALRREWEEHHGIK
jgi:hypothetical protein